MLHLIHSGAEPEGVKNGEERKDGECIEGDCENGKGTKTFPDGTKYVGEFKNGLREGQGTYTYSDGGNYTGEWKDNKRHGKERKPLRTALYTRVNGRLIRGMDRGH